MEARIGEAAGKLWSALSTKGPLAKADLTKAVGLPNDLVNKGIGWLAREDKIVLEEKDKKQIVRLK